MYRSINILSLLLLSALIPATGLAHSAAYVVIKTTSQQPSRLQGKLNQGGLQWQCQGRQCVVRGHFPRNSLVSFRLVVKRIGPVSAFRFGHNSLSRQELLRCNTSRVDRSQVPVSAKDYRQLGRQGLGRVPAHAPEWHNARDADPGYPLDRQAGQLRFGDGIIGRRPNTGRSTATEYQHGAGQGKRLMPPSATSGGSGGEPVNAAEGRLPQNLQHRNRAVSAKDFKPLALPHPDVGIARPQLKPAESQEADDTSDGSKK